MTSRSLLDSLQDIFEAIQSIEKFISGIDFAEFERDEKTIYAVSKALEIIGEAVKNIPESLRNNYPEIPWKAVAGMRDKLVHEYWGTDVTVLWKTTQKSLPILKQVAIEMIAELNNE
jgi:uncharacterized protein with HEPN domain